MGLSQLSLLQNITLVHYINNIILIGPSELEGSNHFGPVGNTYAHQGTGNQFKPKIQDTSSSVKSLGVQ